MDCPFCPGAIRSKIIEEYGSVIAIKDNYPVTEGHLLVIPRRHTPDFFSMTPDEAIDAGHLVRLLRERLLRQDSTISGLNIGTNCGLSAGQTIMHAHIHLIRISDGDTSTPAGASGA